ncbi:MAG: hypothetical protein ACP5SI_03165 [Chloroflexia bacterium]
MPPVAATTPPFFKQAVQAFSFYALGGFLVATILWPFSLEHMLALTLVPSIGFYLLLQLLLLRRTRLRWLLLRYALDTVCKVLFLAALAPLLYYIVVARRWLSANWGLFGGLGGILVGFVLFSWGIEALLQRLLGARTGEENRLHARTLERLNALPVWRVALLQIPRLTTPRREGSG